MAGRQENARKRKHSVATSCHNRVLKVARYNFAEGTKGPPRPKVPTVPVLVARADQAIAAVEAAVEPTEVEHPPPAAPAEDRDVPVAIAIPPDSPGKHQVVVPDFLRNLVLVGQKVLGLALAVIGVQLLAGTTNQLLASDPALLILEEGN